VLKAVLINLRSCWGYYWPNL